MRHRVVFAGIRDVLFDNRPIFSGPYVALHGSDIDLTVGFNPRDELSMAELFFFILKIVAKAHRLLDHIPSGFLDGTVLDFYMVRPFLEFTLGYF
jgi:hypothetical protein